MGKALSTISGITSGTSETRLDRSLGAACTTRAFDVWRDDVQISE